MRKYLAKLEKHLVSLLTVVVLIGILFATSGCLSNTFRAVGGLVQAGGGVVQGIGTDIVESVDGVDDLRARNRK